MLVEIHYQEDGLDRFIGEETDSYELIIDKENQTVNYDGVFYKDLVWVCINGETLYKAIIKEEIIDDKINETDQTSNEG